MYICARMPLSTGTRSYWCGCESTVARQVLTLVTFQLILSALYGIGGAHMGYVTRVNGVLRVCRVFLCVRHGSS